MKFDADKLMRKAIEVMKASQAENRPDGKVVPLVGAVLWMPDETVDTASRGELREGDHAEFTLLERKNRAKKLDGSILFTTLEPCAPGARKEPKLSCAERIVNARIKMVAHPGTKVVPPSGLHSRTENRLAFLTLFRFQHHSKAEI